MTSEQRLWMSVETDGWVRATWLTGKGEYVVGRVRFAVADRKLRAVEVSIMLDSEDQRRLWRDFSLPKVEAAANASHDVRTLVLGLLSTAAAAA